MPRQIPRHQSRDSHITPDLCSQLPVLIIEGKIRDRKEIPVLDLFPHLCLLPVMVHAVPGSLNLQKERAALPGKHHGFTPRILAVQADLTSPAASDTQRLRLPQLDDALIFLLPAVEIDQKFQPERQVVRFLVFHFQDIPVLQLRRHQFAHIPEGEVKVVRADQGPFPVHLYKRKLDLPEEKISVQTRSAVDPRPDLQLAGVVCQLDLFVEIFVGNNNLISVFHSPPLLFCKVDDTAVSDPKFLQCLVPPKERDWIL